MSSNLPNPPEFESFPYAGWIPTVNSRLSFRHIGESRHPTESRYANVTTGQARLVVAYQHRPLSDVLFRKIIHPLARLDGSFYFVLVARSEGQPGETEELRGSIFIYKSKADWKQKGRPAIRPRTQSIHELTHTFDPQRDSKTTYIFAETENLLRATADVITDYRLFRTGEVFFAKPSFADEELWTESNEYALAQGQDFAKWVADQCYFFLRDISHSHQHHAPSSDTVLILQYRNDDDDVVWRRNIVYSLNHYIIRSKRFADGASPYQAMGMVAYCQAFKSICAERHHGPIPGLPMFNDEALVASLRARADELAFATTERSTDAQLRISRAANIRVYALSFVALAIAILAIFVQPLVGQEGNDSLTAIAKVAAANLLSVAAALVLFLLFVWALTHSNWQIRTQIGRDVLEFSNVRKAAFIALYVIAAIIVLAVAVYLGGPAINDMMQGIAAFWNLLKPF